MLKLPKFGRIKAKYNPVPNARERRHHARLMAMPCLACGYSETVFHHLLSDSPSKRWRRDHELGLPLCDPCHRALHGSGNEWDWCMAAEFNPVETAEFLRLESITEGVL